MINGEFICVWDAAQRLGFSCRTVRRLVRRGCLHGAPLPGGKKLWLRRVDVELFARALAARQARRMARARAARDALRQMWLDL